MNKVVRFQTRARTVDHLGREQIADCPTAISELWKNSFDAYAKNASLHIFDNGSSEFYTAAMYDDGHGMSHEEFINKWLVLGTESKISRTFTSKEDRNGLPYRKRQGKKGIGRLSVAFLARLLLIVTRRRDQEYVACLVDWRIFENPYLMLDDIELPIITFTEKYQLLEALPSLFETLMGNIWGSAESNDRKTRIEEAWQLFDSLEREKSVPSQDIFLTTREKLERSIIEMPFNERHLENWSVWQGQEKSGTALLLNDIASDLEAQLLENPQLSHQQKAKDTFRSTLWSFSDPFGEISEINPSADVLEFDTSVVGWVGERRISILERFGGFPSDSINQFEHIVDGEIDETGTFNGRIKAFGQWLPERVSIPAVDIQPTRSDTRVGPFSIFIGTLEIDQKSTTLAQESHSYLIALLESFSGLMVFRDGFRVMPYGRSDSDYFEIEQRRSKHAGREFWNHRRMIGRIAIGDFENPNLKDKAGREGIIDNRASKAFRLNVINVLQVCARRYFGTGSEARKKVVPELNAAYEKRKADEAREQLVTKARRIFRKNLETRSPDLDTLLNDLSELQTKSEFAYKTAEDYSKGLETLSSLKHLRSDLALGRPPSKLSPRITNAYTSFRERCKEADSLLTSLQAHLLSKLTELDPPDPKEVISSFLDKQSSQIRKRLSRWTGKINLQLESEQKRIQEYARDRARTLNDRVGHLVNDVTEKRIDLASAIKIAEEEAKDIDTENQSQLEPISNALASLSESIDLDFLANTSNEEILSLRSDLERLNGLAQLGITVEIISHELESFDATIEHGLSKLPGDIRETTAYKQIADGHKGLASRLRFLSPLKLSGDPERRLISGTEIENFIRSFFETDLTNKSFELEVSSEFRHFQLFDQPSRIIPVFLNLINNARYWVMQSPTSEKRVRIDLKENNVIISDDGTGIASEDIKDLFSLFFTRRRGGRGVGLYLCRANLAAGGHQIAYITDNDEKILHGANFIIKFRTF